MPTTSVVPRSQDTFVALFESLVGLKWRGIALPYTQTKLTLRQDLVQHKFADRDGAHVEGTGRAPLQFSARLPFYNTIEPGVSDTWQQPLYPQQFILFLAACADRTTGELTHPELGIIKAKCEVCDVVWDAQARAGVEVDVTWIESTDAPDDVAVKFAEVSPAASVAQDAADFDANIATALNEVTQPNSPFNFGVALPSTFTDMVNSLQAINNYPSLLNRQLSGKIAAISHAADVVHQSAENTKSALAWPLENGVQAMKAAVAGIQQLILTKQKNILFYKTPRDQTMSAISSAIPAPLGDIITLNSALVESPVVPANTQVRYYAPAA